MHHNHTTEFAKLVQASCVESVLMQLGKAAGNRRGRELVRGRLNELRAKGVLKPAVVVAKPKVVGKTPEELMKEKRSLAAKKAAITRAAKKSALQSPSSNTRAKNRALKETGIKA